MTNQFNDFGSNPFSGCHITGDRAEHSCTLLLVIKQWGDQIPDQIRPGYPHDPWYCTSVTTCSVAAPNTWIPRFQSHYLPVVPCGQIHICLFQWQLRLHWNQVNVPSFKPDFQFHSCCIRLQCSDCKYNLNIMGSV